ncbi:MAG: hypothetical protein V7607_738 [Solirubrobacteraceae bacterium]
MKVLMLTNTVDKAGGLERYVLELSDAICAHGIEVTILAKRRDVAAPAYEERPSGVRVERYAVPSKRSPTFAVRYLDHVVLPVMRELRRRNAETVVHAHFALPALAATLSRTPFAHTFHAPLHRELLAERQGSYVLPRPVQRAAVAAVRASERRVMRRARAIVLLSEFMRTELAHIDPDAANRAMLLPGGVDTDRFAPAGSRPPEGAPLLFTARRLTPRTGVATLIEALPAIAAEQPDVRLAVAGAGGQEGAIRRRIAELGIQRRVDLLGRVSDDELVRWYRRATLVVMPTQELEGFGLTTAEALATGTPVIGTPAGATPELLTPIDPALVSRDTSAAALADAVTRMLADRERCARVRGAARARVHPAMGWPAIAERHLELYDRLGG